MNRTCLYYFKELWRVYFFDFLIIYGANRCNGDMRAICAAPSYSIIPSTDFAWIVKENYLRPTTLVLFAAGREEARGCV